MFFFNIPRSFSHFLRFMQKKLKDFFFLFFLINLSFISKPKYLILKNLSKNIAGLENPQPKSMKLNLPILFFFKYSFNNIKK